MSGVFYNTTGANHGYGAPGAREKAEINAAIGSLEKEKEQLALLLGQKIYDMYKAKGEIIVDEGVGSFISEIDTRADLIARHQEQLRRIDGGANMVVSGAGPFAQGVVPCTCGHIDPEAMEFCAMCGKPQRATEPAAWAESTAAEAKVTTCACGQVNLGSAKFCVVCGRAQQNQPGQGEPLTYTVAGDENDNSQRGLECACDHADSEGADFCAKCGKPQQAKPVEAEAATESENEAAAEIDSAACACGQINPEGIKFCIGCGKPLQEQSFENEPQANPEADNIDSGVQQGSQCACGHSNPEGMKFCVSCGSHL